MTGFPADLPIDLHTHSNVSDGTEPPATVMRAAADAGLGTIALTDHDTLDGWDEAASAAVDLGLTFIPGLEFSTQVERASVHMLGYLVDPENRPLCDTMTRVRESRLTRAERMVERIGMDFPISWEDVLDESEAGATIGRPHIADALVRRGIVSDRNEAFAGILHWQGGYYQPHHAPHPVQAIRLIKDAGGVAVLAHPGSRGRGGLRDGMFPQLVEAGLDGVEIYHRENDEENRALLHRYARKYDLIITGSSDYHGDGKPNRLGENSTEPEQLQRILDRATDTQAR
ncbi:PHP domain-containing protein [Gulosibacter molinativorax]|uniref:PHP domain-containing protein n=1 Tax=Gulosibacter molinativorax TaxID=256821 RepID=A0ABT7C7D0_9MICO|nr:PHP domain-containing protein [Gulosibacter molinativorax]MDJ1370576.1 PHP domain-containing protein [Gulosibacter molinativorax]QUY62008.1 Error-prone DNA polymerase [Gulosibacter molinativorax]